MDRSAVIATAAGIAAVLTLLTASLACAEGASGWDPVLADLGAGQYTTYCAACHGEQGLGDGPVSAALKTAPADLTRIAARRGGEFPTSEIARFIDGRFEVSAHGSREMPVWGQRFSEGIPEPGVGDEVARGRIVSLVEYLKSIQQED